MERLSKEEYRDMTVTIVDKLERSFPASRKFFANDQDRLQYMRELAGSMRQRRYNDVNVNRILYWINEYDNSFIPSVGQLINMGINPCSIENEGRANKCDLLDEINKNLENEKNDILTDCQVKIGKQKIKELLNALR